MNTKKTWNISSKRVEKYQKEFKFEVAELSKNIPMNLSNRKSQIIYNTSLMIGEKNECDYIISSLITQFRLW